MYKCGISPDFGVKPHTFLILMSGTRKEYIPHFALSACPSYEKDYAFK